MNKTNLIFVLIIVGLFLIFSFAADKLVYHVFNILSDKVYSGQGIGKVNHYLKEKKNYNLVIFGSSRANHNIDPSRIDSSGFNMGLDGRKLAYASTLIKLLPKDEKQIILLHIDPENVFSDDYSGDDIKALLPKYNRLIQVKKDIDNLKMHNVFQKFYWSLSYNGKAFSILKNYLMPKYNYKKYNGFDPIKVSKGQRKIFENILKKKGDTNCKSNFKINKIYDNLLNELHIFCQQNNKTLLLFTSPVYMDKCKDDNIELAKTLNSRGLIYNDYTDFYKNDLSIDNWKDKGHLSDIGASIFTDSIRQYILNY